MRLWLSTTETVARLLESPVLVHASEADIRHALDDLTPPPLSSPLTEASFEEWESSPHQYWRPCAPDYQFQQLWNCVRSAEIRREVEKELQEPHWKGQIDAFVINTLGATCPLCGVIDDRKFKRPLRRYIGTPGDFFDWRSKEINLKSVFDATCPDCYINLTALMEAEPGPLVEVRALVHLYHLRGFKKRVRDNATNAEHWRFHPLRGGPNGCL